MSALRSFSHGSSREKPPSSATASTMRSNHSLRAPDHGARAPSASDLVGIGHHQLGVDLEPGPEPVAGRAGAVGRVEREVPGGGLLEAQPAVGAGQVLGEGDGLLLGPVGVDHDHLGHAVGQAQGRLHRLGEALADVVAPHQAVHHHLDGVLLVAGQVQRAAVGQLHRDAVDPGPGEALLGQVVEEGPVLALAAPHHRGQHLEAGALGQGQDAVHDLLGALAGHRPAAVGAVGPADPGVEQSQVVVDLGDRAHRRAGVALTPTSGRWRWPATAPR